MRTDSNTQKSDSGKVRFNMWLAPQVYAFFKRTVEKQGRTMSDVIRQMINDFLSKQEQRDD